MPKNKPPVPRKSASAPQEDDEVMAQSLCDLALEIVELEGGEATELRQKGEALNRLVRNALRKKNDDVLYDALARAKEVDDDAWMYLRAQVEEASATMMIRRDGRPTEVINAFLVPMFVHSTGGLRMDDMFQDVEAFELLRASFQQAGLESPDATVVLISHAYDADEIDRISYSELNEMLREVTATMSEKKMVDTPALAASIAGWSGTGFDATDDALELRFLLGFARMREDDPFSLPPDDEEGIDAYFGARMERYRQWTLEAAPLVRSCLAKDPATVSVDFLYQDLFYSAKAQGIEELAMLVVMSEINHALDAHQLDAAQVSAVVGLADEGDQMLVRVNLYRDGVAGPLASADKPFDVDSDVVAEMDDICDALTTIGIHAVSLAMGFDDNGQPQESKPYVPR
jgi:hypothetical protein